MKEKYFLFYKKVIVSFIARLLSTILVVFAQFINIKRKHGSINQTRQK